jgi:serine/threonine-protein kinase RsbW
MDPDRNEPQPVTLAIVNDPAAIQQAQDQVLSAVEREGYPKASVFAIRLALHEAISNAFHHGHKDLPKTAPVSLTFRVSPEAVELAIRDQGPGFDPGSVPDPTLDANLELPSGRGLMLIKAYMESVDYRDNGRLVEMVYRRPPAS